MNLSLSYLDKYVVILNQQCSYYWGAISVFFMRVIQLEADQLYLGHRPTLPFQALSTHSLKVY